MNEKLIKTSKYLSKILRHDPGKIGLNLDHQGWASIEELLAKSGMSISRDLLDEVVAKNSKQRFAISDDGNLFDAFALAGITALRNATVPAERFEVGEDYQLSVSKTPIMCSYHRVGGRFVFDATAREELGGDERIHITLGDDNNVHSLQKGLKGIFSADEFTEIMDNAIERTEKLRKIVDEL